MSADGRFMAGVMMVVLLLAALIVFIFTCSPSGIFGAIATGLSGALISLITGGASTAVTSGLSGVSFSMCLGWIPAIVGYPVSAVLTVLAVIAGLQVVFG